VLLAPWPDCVSIIRIRIDTRSLDGGVDVVSVTSEKLAARPPHPDLLDDPRVPADTRLWAALQNASGGSWGGCVYDAETLIARLAQPPSGRAAP
jgi:hypothetical protein